MKSLCISWLATVCALATLLLFPNISVSNPFLILIPATLIWLLLFFAWPVVKLVLIPFNLATVGLAGMFVYFFLFWLALWLIPVLSLQPVRIFGFYFGDIGVLMLVSAVLSLLHRCYSWLLRGFFREKRRK
jgi:uncharacterized membrane protein YvlD (DUF360 family)